MTLRPVHSTISNKMRKPVKTRFPFFVFCAGMQQQSRPCFLSVTLENLKEAHLPSAEILHVRCLHTHNLLDSNVRNDILFISIV
jgi:hypothetical protein